MAYHSIPEFWILGLSLEQKVYISTNIENKINLKIIMTVGYITV